MSILFAVLAVPSSTTMAKRLSRMIDRQVPATARPWLPLIIVSAVAAAIIVSKLLTIIWLESKPTQHTAPASPTPIQAQQTTMRLTPAPVSGASADRYQWQALPLVAPDPIDNKTTTSKVKLGRALFFDKQLSIDGTVACASCHQFTNSAYGADSRSVSIGIDNQRGSRNAPTVLNAAFQRSLFWDGRAGSLEQQALGPFINPVEMGMPSLQAVVSRVKANPSYAPLFSAAFPEEPEIAIDTIAKAIASYERTLITPNAPFDRFIRGDESALSRQQIRGMALFESTGCVLCHSGPNFSAASLFERGPGLRLFPANQHTSYQSRYQLTEDLGAAANSKSTQIGVWRVPSLRNVSKTAPYFHNGSVKNLEEAIRVMASTQLTRTLSNDPTIRQSIHWSKDQQRFASLNSITLSDDDVRDIAAFLESLTGQIPETASP